jgi:nanoRNase/pAp phosphatase (c-di-AMP/oligoRNAs hydrolase)
VHNTSDFENLKAESGMLFCDICPPSARVQDFIDVGAIVLDHHVKQREDVERFPHHVFADIAKEPGVSGATLAFREVWQHATTEGSDEWHRAHAFAMLAGIRDTWQTKHEKWSEACAQAEALRFYPWKFFEKVGKSGRMFGERSHARLQDLLSIGPVLIERTRESVKRAIENGSGWKSAKGTHVMVVSTTHTSDIAEAVGDIADLVIGFDYVGGEKIGLQLSMRSRKGYDVGAFCKSLGGGGHTTAAGARVHVSNGDLNPYQHIWKLVDDYERGL